MGVYFGATEITGLYFGDTEITGLYFGDTEIWTAWAEYDGSLPAQYTANGDYLADYRIYGESGGVGDDSGTEYGYEVDMSVENWSPYNTHTGKIIDMTTGDENSAAQYTTAYFNNFFPSTAVISVKADTTGGGRSLRYVPYDANQVPMLEYKAETNFVRDGRVAQLMVTIPSGAAYYGVSYHNGDTQKKISTTTPIYIGSSPLEENEYVDYNSGKIYKYKQVHSDTVTIDGIEWDILGYDHDTVYKSDNTLAQHSVTIQAHDSLSDMQFDAKEALFAFDNGLAAGTYHFTVGAQPWYSGDVGKTIQFTLSSALPEKGQLVINNAYNATMVGATISAYSSGSAGTATETVTMSEGSDGTDLGTITNGLSQDGIINSIQRALFGSNKWSESCIRQYLNSSASAGSVWSPQTKWDRPPSWAVNTAGFLNGLSADFIANLGTTSKITALNTVTDGSGTGTTLDKIFLLSRSEVYAGDEVTGGEGVPYKYYSDYSDYQSPNAGADNNRIKYRNRAVKYWWLRAPYTGNANSVREVNPLGTIDLSGAATIYGIAPACCIPLDDIANNDWLREKFLKPVDPPVPLPALPTCDGTNIVDYAGQSAAVPSRFVAKYRKEGF